MPAPSRQSKRAAAPAGRAGATSAAPAAARPNPRWSRLALGSQVTPLPLGGSFLQRTPNISEPSVLDVVDKVLEAKGIAYATEVTVQVQATGPSGPVSVTRRFDRVFQDPISKEWVFLEGKGKNPQSLTTAQQAVDKLLQEKGGSFEVLEAAGKPPTSPKVKGIAFTKGFKGTVTPGSLHHVSGNMSTSVAPAAAGEVNSLNASAWREGMNARHADVPTPAGQVRYTKPNQAPAKLTQGQAATVTPAAKKPVPRFGDLPRPLKPPIRPGAGAEALEEVAPRGGNPYKGPGGGKPFARVLEHTSPTPQAPLAPEPAPGAAPQAGSAVPEPVPGAAPKAGAGVPEPVPGAAPKAGSATPGAPRTAGRVVKFGVGAVKAFGPAILDAINRHYMAKEEAEKADRLINAKLNSPDVEARVLSLIEKGRLSIARKQIRGGTVYVTVSITVAFTNDVIDYVSLDRVELADHDETATLSSVLRHGGITGATESEMWSRTSLAVDTLSLTPVEANQLELELVEEQGNAPVSHDPEELTRLSEARNQALADQPKLEKAEQQAKDEAIRAPGALADPKEREKQQADINERLRRLAEQQKQAAPAARKPAPTPAAAAPALLPVPAAAPAVEAPVLLPGMPGAGPIEQAAIAVQEAKAMAAQLKSTGSALVDRIGTSSSPGDPERKAWLDREMGWRLAVKTGINTFTSKGRSEAVGQLNELVAVTGEKLTEIRTRLGG